MKEKKKSKESSPAKQDKNFWIKISDLLTETWKIDEISFENKFTDQLPKLGKEWISWKFTMQSLTDSSLLGKLTDIVCELEDVCDSCGSSYMRDVNIPEYVARFVSWDELEKEKEKSEEDVFSIDPKNETIDIVDMVVQAIVLNEPFAKHCKTCEKKIEASSDDEDDLWYFEAKGNVNFN